MLNKEHILDKVYKHFITRDKPFGINEEQTCCSYQDGCSIGIFLTKEQAFYMDRFTGRLGLCHKALRFLSKVFNSDINEDEYSFLATLQKIHDISAANKDKKYLKQELLKFAELKGVHLDVVTDS